MHAAAPSGTLSWPSATGWREHVRLAAFATAAGYAAARLGYAFMLRPTGVAVVWPPAGVMLALLLLIEKRLWPAVLVGAIVGNVGADVQQMLALPVAVAGSAANAIESVLAAWLLDRVLGPRVTLASLRQVIGFAVVAVVVSNAVTALLGSLVIRQYSLATLWRSWFVWWAGDGLGMLIVAPAILTSVHALRSGARVSVLSAIEATVVLGLVGVVGYFLIQTPAPGVTHLSLHYLAFPLLIWAAVRFGPWGAATSAFVLCGVSVWNAAQGRSPFSLAGASPVADVFAMYSYLALASISSLVPAAILRERTLAEQGLRASEQRFRQLAEHIEEAFYVVDIATGRALYVSPTWSDIWGRPIAEAYAAASLLPSVHPDDRDAVAASQAAARNGDSSETTFRVCRPDGAVRWVRRRIYPVRDDAGTVYRFVGVAEDITELRQAEERFAQAQKLEAVGRLAGGVAHDFNNLLAVVISQSDLLLDELKADDPHRGDVETIRRAGDSGSVLVRQLLAFSRQQVLEPKVLQLNELVRATTRMLKRLIGERVELVTVLAQELGFVKVDAGQIEQLIVNLTVNARDAMAGGGTLLIESRNVNMPEGVAEAGTPVAAGPYVMLAVSDTGVGMDADTKARIFEPFFTTKDAGKGTGLGLATVYGVVQQSGGHISVHSELGKGTSFKIYLPRVLDGADIRTEQ